MAIGDPALVRVDRILTEISVGYDNPEYVAEQLFPSIEVGRQSDQYLVLPRDDKVSIEDLRAPSANTREVPPWTFAKDRYYAEEHALKDWVSIEENDPRNNDVGLGGLDEAAERVSDWILHNREVATVNMVRLASNYATNHSITLAGTDQWSDYTNSDPIGDLKAGRDQVQFAIGRTPNVALMGWQVAAVLEDHPDYLSRQQNVALQNNNGLEAVLTLAGIPRLIRAGAIHNTAALGLTPSYSYMWGKDVVLAYVPPNPGRRVQAFGYEFVWIGPERGGRMPTDRWYDTDRKSWAVRTTRRYDNKFISVDAVATGKATGGYLIKAAVA